MKKHAFMLTALFVFSLSVAAQEDRYQWLEEVDGKKALEFVEARNKATLDILTQEKDYQFFYKKSLEIYNSPEKIVYPSIRGKWVYNFWQDDKHERGIWRRCLLSDYKKNQLNWETLLDMDKMSEEDSIKWVYKGASGLYPLYNRFLVQLSKGGGDAVVIREFDADKKQFIENGFRMDEAKGDAGYIDENTILISTDFGEGTMTTSGYPRQVKRWKRGTPISEAKLMYEADARDIGAWPWIVQDDNKFYSFVYRGTGTFTAKKIVLQGNETITLDVPDDCTVSGILRNQLLVQLKSDWTTAGATYKSGALLSMNFSELLKGNKVIQKIAEPDDFSSISGIMTTKNKLLVNMLTNVTNQLFVYSFENGKWTDQKVSAPGFGTIYFITADDFSDEYFFQFANFITPTTLYSANAGTNTLKPYKSLPAFFDGSKFEVKQFKAKSKDGTLVPYFMVASKDIKPDEKNPTVIYAYGGFEVSSQPFYASTFGVSWLEKGGVFVLANIRGGGEFGPKWHQAGLKEKRQNVFDDLYAVSEDLISKKITSPAHLGVMGGSNGGLLVGVAFTQRPELYNAVVCEVPLLDMQRYNKLLAGASWMGEYGNPDIPEEWEYIKKYSPYHNLKTGVKYPEVFFTTSTRDDRVHPGHARKMVAKMNDEGYKTYYYENMEGGHAGSSTNEQTAKSNALIFSYLLMKLK